MAAVAALVASALALLLSLQHLRSMTRGPSARARDLASRLRRIEASARAAKVVELAPAGSWESALASALLEAPTPALRVDAASEAVGDLAALYASRSRWSQAALRIQIAFGILCAALAFASGAKLEAAVAAGVAAIGAILSHLVGDAAATRERRQREVADDLVRLLVPEADGSAGTGRRPGKPWAIP